MQLMKTTVDQHEGHINPVSEGSKKIVICAPSCSRSWFTVQSCLGSGNINQWRHFRVMLLIIVWYLDTACKKLQIVFYEEHWPVERASSTQMERVEPHPNKKKKKKKRACAGMKCFGLKSPVKILRAWTNVLLKCVCVCVSFFIIKNKKC